MKTKSTHNHKTHFRLQNKKYLAYAKPMLEIFTSQVSSRCFNGTSATNNPANAKNCVNGDAVNGANVCAPNGNGNDTIEGYCFANGAAAYSITTCCWANGTGAKPGQDPCNVGGGVQP